MLHKKKLIICEKPSVAFEFSKSLKLNNKNDGFYEGELYVVTWCVGHLCALKDPEEYNQAWAKWTFESLPIIPKRYELKYIDQTKKQFFIVKKLLNDSKFCMVINACDAGREGEHIFQNVYKLSGSELQIFRMWTSAAITDETIKRELENLKPMSQFQGLANAARARACADWSVGINGTRALTLSANIYKEVISIGRVQTPTLSFLVQRELEIKNFKPKAFYQLKANLLKNEILFQAIYEFFDKENNQTETQFFSEAEAKNVLLKIEHAKKGTVSDVAESTKKKPSPNLFNLTELQKECNKIFSFSAQKTLEICQSLYETHKMISYPRTDSCCLPNDLISSVKTLFIFVGEYFSNLKRFSEIILTKNIYNDNKKVFNDLKVTDHHALIPTGLKSNSKLSENEFLVYELICKRFLSSFLDDYVEKIKKVTIDINGVLFKSTGKTPLFLGWKEVYAETKDEDDKDSENNENQTLPNLIKGDSVDVEKIYIDTGKTKPPARYTEATLLAAMENPARFLNKEQADEKNILKDKGLGTPATRAAIIDTIIDRKYCERKSKALVPTVKAISLIQNLQPESLKSPIMTAEWERKLVMIENNEYSLVDFSRELNSFVSLIVETSKDCGKKIKSQFVGFKNEKEK